MAADHRRLSAAIGAALLLAASIVTPVAGAWTSTVVDTMYYFTRPSLDIDSADHAGIASMRPGNGPGIFYSSNASGGWVTGQITTGTDSTPSLAIDPSAHPHVGFVRRSGTAGIYMTENVAGSWTAPALAAADADPSPPSLDALASGKVGMAYTSTYSFAPGLYYVTNASGSWVRTKLLSATWAVSPWLRFDGSGRAHILFSRLESESRGVYYATNATGAWIITKVDDVHGDGIQFAFDGAGKIHAAFRTFDPSGVPRGRYLTNRTGAWVATQLEYGDVNVRFGPMSIGVDPVGGEAHIFATLYDDAASGLGTLFHYTTSSGGAACCVGSSDTPAEGGDDAAPSLGFTSDGAIQLAFRRLYPTAGLRFFSFGSASSLIIGSALVNSGASIDLGPGGVRDVAYDKVVGTGGSTRFATGSGTSWTKVAVGTGNGARVATDIAADAAGKVRIVDGVNYYSNATGSWVAGPSLPFGAETEVEVDAAGKAHVLASIPLTPYSVLDYQTDVTGSWVSDPPMPSSTFDGDVEASLALDGAGKPHIAWIFADGGGGFGLAYQNRVSGSWSSYSLLDSGVNQWPAIAVDGSGKVHIAYAHYGTSPGIYYATNKTGSWVKTRLTRSYSDGAPSIALDGLGKVYVATTRAAQAATPGIYVMTNTTGSWVVTRVVATEIAGEVSLAVTSTGLARFVYDSDVAVHEYESSTTTITGVAPATLDAAFSDIIRLQLIDSASAALPRLGGAPVTDGTAAAGTDPDAPGTSTLQIPRFGSSAPK